MRWSEIVGADPNADARLRTALTSREYADIQRPGLTDAERAVMYGVDTEEEVLDHAERRARIAKINADARKIDAEADRAEAEAAAHRAGIKRRS